MWQKRPVPECVLSYSICDRGGARRRCWPRICLRLNFFNLALYYIANQRRATDTNAMRDLSIPPWTILRGQYYYAPGGITRFRFTRFHLCILPLCHLPEPSSSSAAPSEPEDELQEQSFQERMAPPSRTLPQPVAGPSTSRATYGGRGVTGNSTLGPQAFSSGMVVVFSALNPVFHMSVSPPSAYTFHLKWQSTTSPIVQRRRSDRPA